VRFRANKIAYACHLATVAAGANDCSATRAGRSLLASKC
jgi:hypothetical protein